MNNPRLFYRLSLVCPWGCRIDPLPALCQTEKLGTGQPYYVDDELDRNNDDAAIAANRIGDL